MGESARVHYALQQDGRSTAMPVSLGLFHTSNLENLNSRFLFKIIQKARRAGERRQTCVRVCNHGEQGKAGKCVCVCVCVCGGVHRCVRF